jgi:MFS family permease
VPRLVHDRITWLIYAQLGLWGFFLYGFGPVVPLLRDEQGTSTAVAGLHSTSIAVGSLLGGFLFPAVARRLGRGPTIWLGLAGVAASVGALCLLRPLPATLAVVAIIATFGMLLVGGVNVALAGQHGPAAPAALSEANAACAGMGVLAPLVIGLAVGAGLGWRPAMAVEVALIALVALVAFAFRVRLPRSTPADAAAGTGRGPLPRAYWIAWVLMSVTGSIEVCLSLWAADVLRTHAGLSAGRASAALAAIVGGMFLGRIVGGRIALRLAPVPLLLGALAVSFLGFVIFWVSPVGWLAVAGLLVLGLGNALHYPLAISIALAAAGEQADRAAGYSSYSMAVGFGIAPVVLGRVADGVGPHLAFLLLPVFIAVAVLLALRLGRALRGAAPAEQPAVLV